MTLLFAVERYEEIAQAYIAGLERRVAEGKPVDGLASVASFFVSRVDGKVDAALEKAGRSDLQGKAAIANARVAYESFQRIFSGPRWEALAAHGRPRAAAALGVDVDEEPGVPGHALRRRADRAGHGQHDARRRRSMPHATTERPVARSIATFPGAHRLLDQVRAAGVDIDRICAVELVEEGVAAFAKAFNDLIGTIGSKSAALATAGASADG